MTGSYYSAASFGADNLFSGRRRRSRGRKYEPGSRGPRRQNLSQEFWQPGRRTVVAERTLARDHDADRLFQGVTRVQFSEKFVLGGGLVEPPFFIMRTRFVTQCELWGVRQSTDIYCHECFCSNKLKRGACLGGTVP